MQAALAQERGLLLLSTAGLDVAIAIPARVHKIDSETIRTKDAWNLWPKANLSREIAISSPHGWRNTWSLQAAGLGEVHLRKQLNGERSAL